MVADGAEEVYCEPSVMTNSVMPYQFIFRPRAVLPLGVVCVGKTICEGLDAPMVVVGSGLYIPTELENKNCFEEDLLMVFLCQINRLMTK